MRLTVLNVAYSAAHVGPDAAGGAEQVLASIDAAVVAAGHRSLVVAWEGSRVAGELVATEPETGVLDEDAMTRAASRVRATIEQVVRREHVDVVHMHGIDFHRCLPEPGPTVLVTLHLPPDWYPENALAPSRPGTYLHAVSRDQERRCPQGAPLLPVIENGVPLDVFEPSPLRGRFVLAMGRICPEKCFHLALDAAERAGVPLRLAGVVSSYPAHLRHFEQDLAPRLRGRHRFVGRIGGVRKRRYLAAARALLVPSLAPETSSLVAMEALASGTPVIAFPSGALPGIVEHGVTGFLVDDVREMAEAIASVGEIDRARCRAEAVRRFAASRMQREYLALYETLRAGSSRPLAREAT